jgi:hypothetical protein
VHKRVADPQVSFGEATGECAVPTGTRALLIDNRCFGRLKGWCARIRPPTRSVRSTKSSRIFSGLKALLMRGSRYVLGLCLTVFGVDHPIGLVPSTSLFPVGYRGMCLDWFTYGNRRFQDLDRLLQLSRRACCPRDSRNWRGMASWRASSIRPIHHAWSTSHA